ncbi:hypothetical protein FDECE_3101 [Fusarium decemcellulare]|nr:hypothetical protein FDECE_3101 [Fusarium decemcellulare]
MNGTNIWTANHEFEVRWRTPLLEQRAMRQLWAGKYVYDFGQVTAGPKPDQRDGQGLTIFHESDDHTMFYPGDTNEQALSLEQSAVGTEHDGKDHDESTAVPLDRNLMCGNVMPHQKDNSRPAASLEQSAMEVGQNRILGLNGHRGNCSWDQTWNQRFRINPTSHGTQVETAKEEFEFRRSRRVWKRKRMLIRPDTEQPQTDEESDNVSREKTLKTNPNRRDDQESTIIYESDDNAVSHPEDMDEREVDLERGVTEAEHDGKDDEESVVIPSDHDPMHSNFTPDLQKIDQKIDARGSTAGSSPNVNYLGKSVSSAIASIKSALISIPGKSATSIKLSSSHAVTANSANETSNTIAAWIFGTATIGVAGVTAHATRKTADASMRSARAGELSARASTRSAMAAEESARAGTRSALAAENSVALMKEQLDIDKRERGPPIANGGGIETEFAEVRGLAEEISREQKKARRTPTARNVSCVAGLASSRGDTSAEGPKKGFDLARNPTWIENQITSNSRAAPIVTTTSARVSTSTANAARPQLSTPASKEPFINQRDSKQVPSVRNNALNPLQILVRQKEVQLRALVAFQESQTLRTEAKEIDEERNRWLTRRLQELRNEFA